MLWILRLLAPAQGVKRQNLRQSLPLGAFALLTGLICFQTIPLPFFLLRLCSPTTYHVYEMSLSGWPRQIFYDRLQLTPVRVTAQLSRRSDPAVSLVSAVNLISSGRDVRTDLRLNLTKPEISFAGRNRLPSFARHRPISLSASSTLSALWKLLAYATLFFVIVAYPCDIQDLDRDRTARLVRFLPVLILISGTLIAAIGVVQRLTWNGKILWMIVPDDWGAPRIGIFPRASGPFANSDHFANFLAMVLPLALAAVFFPTSISSKARRIPMQMLGVLGVFTLCAAILLSFSRAGLVAAGLGVTVLCWLVTPLHPGQHFFRLRPSGARALALLIPVGLGLLTLMFVGPVGRNQADARFNESLRQSSDLLARNTLWIDSLKMARDFPFLGVGLGSWPEIFPRYERPPYSKTSFVREPENDYVELLTEGGIFGAGLTAWILVGLAGTLWRGFQAVPARRLPLFSAASAGIVAMVFHEFFDFSFHVPANALLAIMLLGLAVRLCLANVENCSPAEPTPRAGVITGISVLCLLGAGLFWVRPATYAPDEPASLADALRAISAHPARAYLHLSLIRLARPALTPQEVAKELRATLWLEPTNPYARDLYASILMQEGDLRNGLNEITRSIYYSPDPSTHPYLAPQWIKWLVPREQKAIEDGYKASLTKKFKGAVEGLAHFYHRFSRFNEEATLYQASAEENGEDRSQYLLDAGIAYTQARELGSAEIVLRRAIDDAPEDPRPYQYLAASVFAPRKDLAAAKAVISQGIDHGADELTLTFALADAAAVAGAKTEQNAALAKALALRPGSYDVAMRVGSSYLSLGNCERAASALLNATEVDSDSAKAFYMLGTAQEQCYQFANAAGSYERAIEIDPSNAQFRRQLENFRQRVVQNRSSSN
jgi:O-antigen ligase/Tfp pilus assembly protein PilF